MASSLAKILHCCKKSCGNMPKSRSLMKRLEYNSNHVSQQVSSNSTQPILSTKFGKNLLQADVVSNTCLLKYNSTDSWPTVSCACGSYHSQSDAFFSQLLLEEISIEKKHKLDAPHLPNCWSLKQDNCDCKLNRLLDNDSIEVSFNVNETASSGTTQLSTGEQDVVVQPDFFVQIQKESSEDFLTFECCFPQDHAEEESDNAFRIRSVTLHGGKIVESTSLMYQLINGRASAAMVKGGHNVYDQMQIYLETRGINNEFANHLTEIATAVENQQYIVLLENLQKFISCK